MADHRAVFSIMQSDDGRILGSVVDAPVKVGATVRPVMLAPPGPLLTQAEITAYGVTIREALMAHPEIRSVLQRIHSDPPRVTWNLLFGVSDSCGEAIRWEVLLNELKEHLTMCSGRRLFRVAADPSSPQLHVRNLPPVIRVAAFLSPAGVDATPEFKALERAVVNARRAGLQVELHALVGQPELLQAKRDPSDGIFVRPIPDDHLKLQSELQQLRPHLVHFFCHGLADVPQSLQFATVAEQMSGILEGSVLFSIDRLIECGGLVDAWTVVFNCCDGGRSTKTLNSMAFRIVAEAGTPAAIGMGAPLPAGAAPLFTAAFYRTLLNMITGVSAQVNRGAVEIDFGESIVEGRRALQAGIAGSGVAYHCWALPIIYLHPGEFIVQKAPLHQPEAAGVTEKVRLIAGLLQSLPAAAPAAMRADMLALFDQAPAVPVNLRCDANGQFLTGRR